MNELLIAIKNDLEIEPYTNENNEKYFSRVIYSCLALWLKSCTLDKVGAEPGHSIEGVSKAYNTRVCSNVLEEFLKVFPSASNFFYGQGKDNPIEFIRNILLKNGELTEIGFETNIGLTSPKSVEISDQTNYFHGIPKSFDNLFASGLSFFSDILTQEHHLCDALSYFSLKSMNSRDFFDDYAHSLTWNDSIKNIDNIEIFNSEIKKPISYCWQDNLLLENDKIYMARQQKKYDTTSYSLIKLMDGIYYQHEISSYSSSIGDAQRLIYALRLQSNNSIQAEYKKYDQYVKLKLYSRLPKAEEDVFFLIGWPIDSINDWRSFIFREEVWEFVDLILGNLCISLKEVKDGSL